MKAKQLPKIKEQYLVIEIGEVLYLKKYTLAQPSIK